MDLSSTGIAEIVIYSVTLAASYDFWRDFGMEWRLQEWTLTEEITGVDNVVGNDWVD